MVKLSKLLALVCSSGFSVGLLLTSIVLVESWGAMEPAAAIDWFVEFGLPLGIVMVPFGGLAAVFAVVTLVLCLFSTSTRQQTVSWLVVAVLTVCTMALLPLYFWDANTLFFDGIIQPSDVAVEISRWSFWNWVRTGVSITATALMLSALIRENAESG